MKKKLAILFIVLVLLGASAVAAAGIWWTQGLKAPSTSAKTQTVLVTKGSNASDIAVKLKEAGVIKDARIFTLYVRLTKTAASLPVGEFLIPGNLTVPEVISFLQKGPQEVWVTIPEGLRREQLPDRFSSALGFTDAQKRAFRDDFLAASEGKEGYLFPETYLVPLEITAEKVVQILTNTFQKKTASIQSPDIKNVVILASLLERETLGDGEKPTIAGILTNRMRIGMPLQVDATVQYAKANLSCSGTGAPCADWWPTVYLDDYKIKSGFNTYQINGLPPAPIASPGITSLAAAANPAPNDYLYYIHDAQGVAHYAKTLDEHNANIQKYLR